MVNQDSYIIKDVACEAMESCKIYPGADIRMTSMGKHVVIGEDSYVNRCNIGDYVQINRRNHIDDVDIAARSFTGANTKISHARIGKFTSISWNVCFGGGARHSYERLSMHPFYQLKQFGLVDENEKALFPQTVIGNDVWIGMGALIMAGVSIGDGAVIGAGSIVTKDIPPYAIAYGGPASIRKYRFDERTIEKLQQWKWWDWPDCVLRDNIELFREELDEKMIYRIQKIYEEAELMREEKFEVMEDKQSERRPEDG